MSLDSAIIKRTKRYCTATYRSQNIISQLDLDDQDHKTHTYMIMNNKELTSANVYDKLWESKYPKINETRND